LPRRDYVEGVTGVVLEHDYAALRVTPLADYVRERLQIRLRQTLEEGNPPQDLYSCMGHKRLTIAKDVYEHPVAGVRKSLHGR
jgi:hypothetical protein